VTDRFTFVPDDPRQPTYTAKATSWGGANLSSQNNFTATFTTHVIAKGTDGSRITGHVVAHTPCARTARSPSSSRRTG
jgi:hypothetical protein